MINKITQHDLRTLLEIFSMTKTNGPPSLRPGRYEFDDRAGSVLITRIQGVTSVQIAVDVTYEPWTIKLAPFKNNSLTVTLKEDTMVVRNGLESNVVLPMVVENGTAVMIGLARVQFKGYMSGAVRASMGAESEVDWDMKNKLVFRV
ncbi:hypothetical protein GLAREA_07238 [Glarea lozoyensis ATCC 20868]|uniref:Uncharacterized protein n=1 Tax=Glarea lozoyensis (strain ATCC 20868 / MF5171) TaxID=1116229 RepID=S3D936_GLAL2|nr:uncharacterized protein GLAREA_07238 [Glarea lozoyensis ATCC 20868]EPE34225.1 hypothetical protein GLAREA_07238 [Glarea lozoyensis ATCC 20868]